MRGSSFIAMTSNSVLYHCEGSALDSSGNGNTATLSNVTTGAVGKVGTNAWSYDTTAAVAATTTNLVCTGDYTFAFWFHTLGADGTTRSALHSASGTFLPMLLHTTGSNTLGLWNGSFQSSGFTMAAADYVGWHHIALVAYGAQTDFYVNGRFAGSVAVKLSNAMRYIGNQNTASQRFALRLDEIAFWTRALARAEIETLYINQSGAHAGRGTTFGFTPDEPGTYTVQFTMADSLRDAAFPLASDSANAVITDLPPGSGVWPQEALLIMPGVQGQRLKRHRGQM